MYTYSEPTLPTRPSPPFLPELCSRVLEYILLRLETAATDLHFQRKECMY